MKHFMLSCLTASLIFSAPGLNEQTNAQNNMDMNKELLKKDPELEEILRNFAFDEALQYGNKIDAKTSSMLAMASCIALQSHTMYNEMLESAWKNGVTPVEIKEVLYHAVPYAGMGKTLDFITSTNEFLESKGVELPLEEQSTTTTETRFSKGLETQKSIFGEQIDKMRATAPDNQKHIQDYLCANCFGAYYTRTGLDIKTREAITYAILISLGGCEPQVKGHIAGNLNVGNDKEYLLEATTRLLPLIGYPKTLNAIACLNEVAPESNNTKTITDSIPENLSAFPVGGPNPPVNSRFFIGQSYLAQLTKEKSLNCPIYNVTFEPGCRNNWHSHTGGQILIAVGGKGLYQERGKEARLLMPGDIVEIVPNVEHWHGATPDSWFSHLAIECNPQTNKNTWLEAVDDTWYLKAAGTKK